jgi:hypothetical protein
MIYNSWGELFYITSTPHKLPSLFVVGVYPWWMTLLFALAGISSYYALQKRSTKEYAAERIHKLFIPLLVGLVLFIPVQSYIADVFYNGYSGGYLEHYKIFFTRFTYLTGQDGGFTVGHLWFLLYLFVISMIALPIMHYYGKSKKRLNTEKLTIPVLLPFFLIILFATLIPDIGGKNVAEFLACFLLGYFVLSQEEVQIRLERNRILLAILFLAALVFRLLLFRFNVGFGLVWDIEQRMVTWFGILAILGMGKRYLDHSNHLTAYFSKAAFPLYYFHQSILVVIGFICLKYIQNVFAQFLITCVGSFALSILCYEVFKRSKVTSYLFGIKHCGKKVNDFSKN